MFSVISLLRYLQYIQLESLFKHARRTFSESPFNAFSRNICLVLNTLNVGYLRCLQPAKYCHNLHLFLVAKRASHLLRLIFFSARHHHDSETFTIIHTSYFFCFFVIQFWKTKRLLKQNYRINCRLAPQSIIFLFPFPFTFNHI